MYRPHRAVSGKDLTRMSGREKLDSHSVIGGNDRSHGNTSTPVDTPSAAPPPADTPPCSATPVTQSETHTHTIQYTLHTHYTVYAAHTVLLAHSARTRRSDAAGTAQPCTRTPQRITLLPARTPQHSGLPYTPAAGYTTSPAGEQGRCLHGRAYTITRTRLHKHRGALRDRHRRLGSAGSAPTPPRCPRAPRVYNTPAQ